MILKTFSLLIFSILGILACYLLALGLIEIMQFILSFLFYIGRNVEPFYTLFMKMKNKIFIFLLGIVLFSSCEGGTFVNDKENPLTVYTIYDNRIDGDATKYKYRVVLYNSQDHNIILLTDSLYSIGDTLKIIKK